MARLNLKRVPLADGNTPPEPPSLTVDQRNRPIIDFMGEQAVTPGLPAGATYVGAGQVAKQDEFVSTGDKTIAPLRL